LARVSIVRGDERYGNVARALELIRGDIDPAQVKGKRVLVKPNLVSDSVELAVTPVEAVKAVIDFASSLQPSRVVVAEGSAGDTWRAFRNFGYTALEKMYGVELVDLNEDGYREAVFTTLDGSGRTVRVAKTAVESDFRFSVARAKTHDHVFCTLCTKNMLGCVVKGDRVWAHGAGVEPQAPLETVVRSNYILSKNLVALARIVRPHVGVIDAFLAMEGDGPVGGSPVELRLAVASTDFVAADAVMARVMGFNPLDTGYIYLSDREALGNGDLRNIDVLGGDPEKLEVGFKPHRNYYETQVGWKTFLDQTM